MDNLIYAGGITAFVAWACVLVFMMHNDADEFKSGMKRRIFRAFIGFPLIWFFACVFAMLGGFNAY